MSDIRDRLVFGKCLEGEARDEIDRLRTLLREVLTARRYDYATLDYVSVQVPKEWIERAQKALGEG